MDTLVQTVLLFNPIHIKCHESPAIHMSLMAKGSKVTPTSHSNITPNEESDDEDDSD
jgi:hypothetical protein